MRLLVVEDEPRISEIIKAALERAEFAVDTVRLRADAREALANTAYDAAILDLGLPDGDGLTKPPCRFAAGWKPHTHFDPHGTRCGGGPCSRPRCGGRRLPREAVRDERARCPHEGAAAPSGRGARHHPEGRQYRLRYHRSGRQRRRHPVATPSS